MVVSREKCRLSDNKKKFFRKNFSNENCTILIYFVERNPLRSISVTFVGRIFLWTHCRVLPMWVGDSKCARKLVTLEGWVISTREVTLNNKYLSQFLLDRKVLWMTFEQLFEIIVNLPMFNCSRATCVLLQGQNQLLVPSGREKARITLKFSYNEIVLAVASNRSRAQAKDFRKLQ